jgi:hypothetical protein
MLDGGSKMKTIYRVRLPNPYNWQSTHKTLEEAIAHAKEDAFFKDNPKTIIEKITTELVWKNEEKRDEIQD